MRGLSIDEIQIGDSATFEKTITETDVYMYAGISGDINPAHINEEFMKKSIFRGRIVHGMLTAGLVSAVLGNQLPGPGTIYLGQEIKFKAPVRFNDTVKATVKVIEKLQEKNRLVLETICKNQEGTVVFSGKATVMPPTPTV